MTVRATFRELFDYGDWGNDKLLAAAATLSDALLDRPFEIGCGKLRETLRHLYGAERIWYERWNGSEFPEFPRSQSVTTITDLAAAWRQLADARNRFIDRQTGNPFTRPVTYTNTRSETRTHSLGDLMLHVCNHGVHHRAQALNLLRRTGGKPMGLDQLFMRAEQPTLEYSVEEKAQLREMGFAVSDCLSSPNDLDADVLRRYFVYCDWANAQLHAAAANLTDEQLDREHDIGLKRLRKTLLHICDADAWWYLNWTSEPRDFQQLADTTSIEVLRRIYTDVNRKRDEYLAGLKSNDLRAEVRGEIKPGVYLRFRLGETILELLEHGTHHRAQALNMLRHLGATPPPLDYIDYVSQIAGSG